MKFCSISIFIVLILPYFSISGVWSHLENCPEKNPSSNELYWDEFTKEDCDYCGYRKYTSRLWNIETSLFNADEWYGTCANTYGKPDGINCILPTDCNIPLGGITLGLFVGIRGNFYVPDSSCKTAEYWGTMTPESGCPFPGKKRYWAKLYDAPPTRYEWKKCCERQTDILVIDEKIVKVPSKCEVTWSGVYGYFDVSDIECVNKADYTNTCPATPERKKRSQLNFLKNEGIFSQVTPNRDKRALKFPSNTLIHYTISDEPEINWKAFNNLSGAHKSPRSLCDIPQSGSSCPDPIVTTIPGVIGMGTKVKMVLACIRQCNIGNGSPTNQAMRDRAKLLGENNIRQYGSGNIVSDDAGHIVGNALGGSGTDPKNIFPQNVRCNRGHTDGVPQQNRGWREVEDYIRGLVRTNEVVEVFYELLYDPDTETRPVGINVEVLTPTTKKGFILPNPSNTET